MNKSAQLVYSFLVLLLVFLLSVIVGQAKILNDIALDYWGGKSFSEVLLNNAEYQFQGKK